MGTLASWLRRCGHRTHTSGIRLNVDCSAAAIARLEQRLEAWVEQEGEPAVVIGQSRGGLFARVLAVRRPDLVGSVVTLGSPHLDPLAVHPLVWLQGAAIAGLAALGVPGLASSPLPQRRLLRGVQRRTSRRPMPKGVRFVSIYSRAGRHRRLAGVPRSARGPGRGAVDPLRHGREPGRVRAARLRAARSRARAPSAAARLRPRAAALTAGQNRPLALQGRCRYSVCPQLGSPRPDHRPMSRSSPRARAVERDQT